jgi:Transposase DDE domain group 1
VLLPVIARYRELKVAKFFRGDAAFASPKLMKLLEAEGYGYAIRLKANAVLERHIAHLLKRPVSRPSKKPKVFYHAFRYQAKSWDRARRVVAKVEWHAGELFPRVGFVVTNLRRRPKRVIKFYNGRGTAEQWIKAGEHALNWTRLSCRRFKDNQVRLQLFALAYNLGNFLRQLALPRSVRTWTLTTLRGRS